MVSPVVDNADTVVTSNTMKSISRFAPFLRRFRKRCARLVILLLSVAIAECTTMGLRTSGVTGPVSWQATELQWQHEIFDTQQIYTFTLVLHETQGADMLFTQIHAILRNASESRPAYWEKTGQWLLPTSGSCAFSWARGAGAST